MEVSRFPDFSFIKLEPLSPCPSPALPVLPSARGKGGYGIGCYAMASLTSVTPVCVDVASAVKQEVKVEPNPQDHPSCSNTDLVTIAITLNPIAAQVYISSFIGRGISSRRLLETSHFLLQNIGGVVAAVAQLLRVPVPGDYQLSRTAVADHGSLALLAGVCVPLTRVLKRTWSTIFRTNSKVVELKDFCLFAGLSGQQTAQTSTCCWGSWSVQMTHTSCYGYTFLPLDV